MQSQGLFLSNLAPASLLFLGIQVILMSWQLRKGEREMKRWRRNTWSSPRECPSVFVTHPALEGSPLWLGQHQIWCCKDKSMSKSGITHPPNCSYSWLPGSAGKENVTLVPFLAKWAPLPSWAPQNLPFSASLMKDRKECEILDANSHLHFPASIQETAASSTLPPGSPSPSPPCWCCWFWRGFGCRSSTWASSEYPWAPACLTPLLMRWQQGTKVTKPWHKTETRTWCLFKFCTFFFEESDQIPAKCALQMKTGSSKCMSAVLQHCCRVLGDCCAPKQEIAFCRELVNAFVTRVLSDVED